MSEFDGANGTDDHPPVQRCVSNARCRIAHRHRWRRMHDGEDRASGRTGLGSRDTPMASRGRMSCRARTSKSSRSARRLSGPHGTSTRRSSSLSVRWARPSTRRHRLRADYAPGMIAFPRSGEENPDRARVCLRVWRAACGYRSAPCARFATALLADLVGLKSLTAREDSGGQLWLGSASTTTVTPATLSLPSARSTSSPSIVSRSSRSATTSSRASRRDSSSAGAIVGVLE
jgi:hypothetical protein